MMPAMMSDRAICDKRMPGASDARRICSGDDNIMVIFLYDTIYDSTVDNIFVSLFTYTQTAMLYRSIPVENIFQNS